MNEFETKVNNTFKQQVESLDSQTLCNLRMVREKALAQQQASQPWAFLTNLKGLAGAGAGLALASLLVFIAIPNFTQSKSVSLLEDFEILKAEPELDLYTQLDFYQWIENESSFSENTL